MWVFLSDSFLSIVAHRTKSSVLLVRARVDGDIERVFPGVKVRRTPAADYLFRAEVRRRVVGSVLADQVSEIRYENFKGSVNDADRHESYMRVWSAMNHLQYMKRPKDQISPRVPTMARRRPKIIHSI